MMGHALCLQNWTNITGVASQTIVQRDCDWVDIAGYQDVVVYLDVSQITAQGATTTTLFVQTAPERNETIFTSTSGQVVTYPFTGTPGVGLQTLKFIRVGALARFLRWSLVFGTVATSVHFRIWLNLNQAGW
jgi:hypothetical protein